MNILFYLTPKCDCAYVEESDSLRQVLEKMENRGYSSIPLLDAGGGYVGTLTEGDLLWYIKNSGGLDMKAAEHISVSEIKRRRDYIPVFVSSDMKDLIRLALNQNFIPVLDDTGRFIGIVTRTDMMKYYNRVLTETGNKNAEDRIVFKL